ncbi:MAG TPA: ferric reductase-like transmembrane domain-containing protein [Trebonia sp.]|nr:ferric reductase-like transmembrane domain-containing protein [Trebonia sp.]
MSPPFGQRPPGAAQRHAAQPQAAQPQSAQLPPPEWADPAVGRRWTQSWRVRPTGTQPRLPQDQPRMPQGPSPAGRQTGQMGQLPPWETAAAPQGAPTQAGRPVRATGANPLLDPTRATGGLRTTGALSRTTGAMRATGAHASADANTVAGALRTTGAMRTTGATQATGPMRTARPISPGTGKARIVLPIVVLAIIGLGLLGTMYLWWRNTLFMHTPGAILTDIGEVLGLLAGYGVIILVALMSRLPPLEKAIGTDRLARWHAFGGRWVVTVTCGHVVFIIWGYSVTARQNLVSETVTLWTTFPDVLMATVAWLLLLMVAGFSLRAARRRIAYETWYYAHLYTYLAIALAFSHQFADGGAFAESFQARALWTTLYALIGASLVWFRVVTPIRRTMRHQFTVQSVRPEAEGIVSVLISGRDFDHLRAEPGQFFRWRFLTRELWWQSHPYSLSAMPQPNLMRITVKARGDHSGSLANLKPGTRIVAEGPYGAFTPSLTGRRVLFIAGGVGITPIRAMFAALPKRMSGGITLLYRASHPRDVVFSRELNAIAGDRNAALHYLIGSRQELGYDPLDADHLQRTVPGLHRYEAYVCGPTGMTQAAVDALVEAGIPRRRIHHESFDF